MTSTTPSLDVREVRQLHTRGPWFFEFSHYEDSPIYIQTHAGVPLNAPGSTIGTANSLDDARLIAAAPDLLKACQQALYALKGREHDGFLRVAIAKALGESA